MATIFLTLTLDFIFAIVSFYFPSRFLSLQKRAKWAMPLLFTIFYTICVIVRVFPIFNMSIIKTAISFVIYFLNIFLSYCNKPSEKIIVSVFFSVAVFIADMLTYFIEWIAGIDYGRLYGIVNGRIIGIFIECVLLLLFSYFFEIFYKKIKGKKTNNIGYFIIIILSQFLLIIALSYAINSNETIMKINQNNIQFMVLLFTSFAVSIISDILLYRILTENYRNYELKEELATTKYQKQLEFEYYKSLKNNMDQTRKINHDFMNMLSVLQNLIEADSKTSKSIAQNTINELKDKLNQNKIKQYCNNELVNLIINNKKTSIDNYGIDFSANIQIPETISVKNIDICRIFTNLLDNAIEASLDCSDKTKTFIIISAGIKNDCLLIKCENYYDKALSISKKGKLNSTKDKDSHDGLGISILNETVKEYNGEFTCSYNNNTFIASLMLKL